MTQPGEPDCHSGDISRTSRSGKSGADAVWRAHRAWILPLSLLSYLNAQTAVVPEYLVMGVNCGSDKVRYLAPVRVGKRIRSCQKVLEVTEKKPGQWIVKSAVTVEIEGEETPPLIAEILSMMVVGYPQKYERQKNEYQT